ncbi:MAG: transposase DNA-binding-containing protein, partial [Bacteroidota bacterium]
MSFTPLQRSGLRFLSGSIFNDKRLSRRYSSFLTRMIEHQSNTVGHISLDEAESRGYYRFLANERVSHSDMLEQVSKLPSELISQRSLVVLGDTTEISLKSQISHLKDADRVGVLSDNKTPGYMAQAHLVLDAQHGGVLGLSDLMLWTRPASEGSK